jgi:hypoxanthine-guanine phosphoribosyltransferase
MITETDAQVLVASLVASSQIQQKVRQMGERITTDYRSSQKLLLVGVLRGAVVV